MIVKKIFFYIGVLLLGTLLVFSLFIIYTFEPIEVFSKPKLKTNLFPIESIDTMKYSRDQAQDALNNPKYDAVIDAQMVLIEKAGATHVAIATPYDAEFVPVLARWVESARKHHLSVWFRGNFSGWEGWFGYDKLNRDAHEKLLTDFIARNPTLFAHGDVFTPCPECENGGPGDPRKTGDAQGYRDFLIREYNDTTREFRALGVSVTVYNSMNGDIARTIMTPASVRALGGTILIDHYVNSADKFASDITMIPQKFNGKVGLGEFGAPIPDLNGDMSPSQQAQYVNSLFRAMYLQNKSIPIVNYWTLAGGSTALVGDDGVPKPAYYVVKSYYRPPFVYGMVYNSLGEPLMGGDIMVASTSYTMKNIDGSYQMFLTGSYRTVTIEQKGYKTAFVTLPDTISGATVRDVYLDPVVPTFSYNVRRFIYQVLKILPNQPQ